MDHHEHRDCDISLTGMGDGVKLMRFALHSRYVNRLTVRHTRVPDGGVAYTATAYREGWWRRPVTVTYTAPPGQHPSEAAVQLLATVARRLGLRVQAEIVDE